jgi:HKD family nuclease
MEFLNQPISGQLGDRLISLLSTADYHTLNIVVAFAKNSGVLRLRPSLEQFRARGGEVNVYVGVDLNVTSYEALTALRLCATSLNAVHSEAGQTFHPKIYQFLGQNKGLIVVGSHNLTAGGLWTNFESSALISLDTSSHNDIALQRTQSDYIARLAGIDGLLMPIASQDDVDRLLRNGYISKEVSQQVHSARATKKAGDRETLFGNGVFAVSPRAAASTREDAAEASDASPTQAHKPQRAEDDVIWFETKLLTGGSRNIIDLSKKCRVERGEPSGTRFDLGEPGFMRGAVEFFGVDPSATNVHIDITINFEGVDYSGNTILFPDGDNANGTWRLQVKGVSPSGKKITEAFRATGEPHYLVRKVVAFKRIQDGHYALSVFPESELQDFAAASQLLARNGVSQNAKQLGVL